MAAGRILASHYDEPTVLIGKDTRISGYILEAALEAGFASAGVNVVLAGPMPTPAIAYLTRTLRLSAGVVISASHNPFEDNGIKFFDGQGEKLPDAIELEIEKAIDQPQVCADPHLLGKARRLEDAAGRYIEFCKGTFPSRMSLKGMRLVVDSAHGAAYHVAGSVFHELGAEVIRLGDAPDGFNINQNLGAASPQAMAQKVREVKADFGIALDGDGDRLAMADASGRLFNGDELLYVLARHRVRHMGKGAVQGVVGTLMSNLALEHRLLAMGLDFRRAKVGDRYVLEMLKETGWELGGESSGHLLCLDKHTTGDGIVSALQVLAALVWSEQSLVDYMGDLRLYPQVMINHPLVDHLDWKTHAGFQRVYQDVSRAIEGSGRVLIRPSGTEPVLRIMVESPDEAEAQKYAQALADALT
jgi:phosphoglucosamine mutase